MTVLDGLVEKALRRLALPRVGLLWWYETAPESFVPPETVSWIHYLAPGCVFPRDLRPAYRLSLLSAPEEEALTLDMLVVPAARVELLRDLLDGLPASPEGRLAAGCLGARRPLLLDVSALARWSSWSGPIGSLHRRSLERLRDLGCVLLGGEGEGGDGSTSGPSVPTPVVEERPRELCLDRAGWVSWLELAPRLKGIAVVRLGPSARLTDEARDRLRGLGVALKEG
ncbi:hypothetical protein KAR29_12015 [Aminithiophilus ramosus]|uniref:Uncharacterized protein n=1 Tax=Aminithiophilus ramosus TaxID=3029084 RepID=A0A9Q7ACR8_9BACT|nr:hypothetical protein [Aminithiophilus ramosus]QTX32024.1 hypothetical protein KAR29_12015 [Aminithiophilus ramosus]